VAEIAAAVLGRLPEERRATTCSFRDERGEQIDEGIALYFSAPRSYTGEPVLELQGHGGPVVLQAILAACLDAGARVAEPGEFTRRAFLEGRMDLAQAEAVADLIDAASREAARSALRSLTGEFSSAIGAVADQVVELRALTEAMLDFPEEDVDSLDRGEAVTRLDAIHQAMNDLLAKSRQGSLLRSGIHVVLAGRPNVGKSSLLNRLSGEERAIVTPIPGTTRDVLREPIQIDGVPLVLVDTAGLRASGDMVERMGMERACKELDQADVVLAVFEVGDAAVLEQVPTGATRIDVYNKVDLVPGFRTPDAPHRAVAVSAKTGEGMAVLRKLILDAVGWASSGESTFLARERHLRAFESARAHMEAARQELGRWELFAEELRLAHVALGSVTGEFSADDLLGEIFGRFCIGK
jgi:tRNA modification GTPase